MDSKDRQRRDCNHKLCDRQYEKNKTKRSLKIRNDDLPLISRLTERYYYTGEPRFVIEKAEK